MGKEVRITTTATIVAVLLIGIVTSSLNSQPIKAYEDINPELDRILQPYFIYAVILDINASSYRAHVGDMVHVYVTVEATWDVLDFSSYYVEAFYDSYSIERKITYVFWSGHQIITYDFAWNTSGVNIGSHLISAKTSTMSSLSDGYVLILPVEATIVVPDDFSTIQGAINNANAGDTIFVRSGTYYEHVVVNKTLSLVGESTNGTVLNSTDIDPSVPIMIIEADDVKIRGFTFEGWSFRNIVVNATNGAVIIENRIVFNSLGILVENSVNTTTENNVIIGFGLDNIGIMLDHSTECRIANNTITNAVYDGVRLWFSNNNLLSCNLIISNDFGMFLHGSNGNTVSENTISESGGPGMYFEEDSSDNVIVHNNFIDNWTPVGFWDSSSNAWNNTCEGNYWSDYNGTDSDYDGIGDTPYIIDSNNIDNYPLMNPYWVPADVNHDLEVSILDVVRITGCYGTTPLDPEWNPHADIAEPFGKIDILDIVLCTSHYGEKYS